jgi:hypothetical protein
MLLTQFQCLNIYSYKFIDHQNKINILTSQANKFDIP